MVSVIASSVRKGQVLEQDGKLYVVIRAENIHPGKGTPVTHLEMRRISDGVKVQERFKKWNLGCLSGNTYNAPVPSRRDPHARRHRGPVRV